MLRWHSSPCKNVILSLKGSSNCNFCGRGWAHYDGKTLEFHSHFHGIISTWNLAPMSEENVDIRCKLAQTFLSSSFWISRQSVSQNLRLWVRIMQTQEKKEKRLLFPSGFYLRPILWDSTRQSSPNRKPGGEALTMCYVSSLHASPLCQPRRVEPVSRWTVGRVGDRKFWGCG